MFKLKKRYCLEVITNESENEFSTLWFKDKEVALDTMKGLNLESVLLVFTTFFIKVIEIKTKGDLK